VRRFAEVRADFEEIVRQNFGEVQWANIDIMASSMMANYYGMELHARVNDATAQAISGKISKTRSRVTRGFKM
jgi:hypothetical protein